ncbi:hypothetical protein J7E99_14025 [Streptomyces sp. ISL-44]|uniref:DUF6153 family protein n=1 Tax=Streptomyces sp. ISL-44 TaxID=2819184 RepID=UPI001BE7433B|nr:DUF6153 family protein [Streptomyces sp. ISL-44]MBT2541792.1 hypothetical protein [Streptomyces sp. ISL-44]
MTSAAQPSGRRPAGRGFVLLVFAVMASVLAMHGLGPGATPVRQHVCVHVAHSMVMAESVGVHQATEACSHTAGGSEHLHHADATCAAAGIGAPYAPPPLAAATLDGASAAVALPGFVPESAETGRAPPDLAELQLLRI